MFLLFYIGEEWNIGFEHESISLRPKEVHGVLLIYLKYVLILHIIANT